MRKQITILFILVIVISMTSCNKEFCQKKYPCNDIDSVVRIVDYDTTYLQMPADTTFIELPIDCPDQKIVYRDGKKEVIYKIKDRVLTINEVTFADSIRIINQFKESKEFKQYAKEIKVPTPYIPKWFRWLFIAVLSVVTWQNRFKIINAFKWLSKLILRI